MAFKEFTQVAYDEDDNSFYYLTNAGVWEPLPTGSLPSQTGNAGKVLKTDGNAASWEDVTVSIPATVYENNADAVAALGAGKLYKSNTQINGSPIILITI